MSNIHELILAVSKSGKSVHETVMELAEKADKLGVWDEMEPIFNKILEKTAVHLASLQLLQQEGAAAVTGEQPDIGESVWKH